MATDRWQKSSYCQEGDACVHISANPHQVHITDTDSDPARTIVTVSREAFAALLKSL
ncbi:DUF397 domain-containing protein [Streptomyces griseorubiginosus]|uniref:DUF397 domain-containing protein n=1 Tax=Streptomyces griseorubiginosus TaxID=67304 RepID=UPI0033B3475E